jgi:hypothetical protein
MGVALAHAESMVALLSGVGADSGAAVMKVIAHMMQASLGNHQAARDGLYQLDSDALRNTAIGDPLAALAWAVALVEANDDEAPDQIEQARSLFKNDGQADFSLDLLQVEWNSKRNRDIAVPLAQLRERATNERRRDHLAMIEIVHFETDPGAPAAAKCDRILASYRRYITPELRCQLLALTAERLAKQGDCDRSRIYFQRAQREIAAAAAAIADDATRQAFVRQVATPLRRAVIDTPSDRYPIFIGETTLNDTSVNARSKGFFANATVFLGVLSVVFAIASLRSATNVPASSPPALAMLSVLLFVLALVSTMISILRQERRNRLLLLGTVLATLGMLTAILSNENKRAKSAPRNYRPVVHNVDSVVTTGESPAQRK